MRYNVSCERVVRGRVVCEHVVCVCVSKCRVRGRIVCDNIVSERIVRRVVCVCESCVRKSCSYVIMLRLCVCVKVLLCVKDVSRIRFVCTCVSENVVCDRGVCDRVVRACV